jgi:hypothetical protein
MVQIVRTLFDHLILNYRAKPKEFWEDTTVLLTFASPLVEVITSWLSGPNQPEPSKRRHKWIPKPSVTVGLLAALALVKFTLLNRIDEQNSASEIAGLQKQAQLDNVKLIDQGNTLTDVAQNADTAVTKLNAEIAKADATAAAANLELARFAAPLYTIPVHGGVATPDLAHGLTQRVLLHSNIAIDAPKLPLLNKDGTTVWTLFVDQDALGNHTYTMNFLEGKTTWPGLIGNSRASYELITNSAGHTLMRSVPIMNTLKSDASATTQTR